jgi:DNA-directed RNA polymerase specialized sigma24 family protein
VDLRDFVPFPSHWQPFEVAYSEVAIATQRNPDKDQLRSNILDLRAIGMSYREIAAIVGIHWTRVAQRLKKATSGLG